MYRSVLVPLDGSSFGEQALRMAASYARPVLSVLRDRRALCPQASLLPPVALGRDGLEITKYNRIASAVRLRKKLQSPLEIGGQVEQIHDLTYSRSGGLRLPLAKFA
jgi:hypothetical protein